MRAKLWNELVQAKFNNIYSSQLIAWSRNLNSAYNIFIIIFSSSGLLGWKVFTINYSSIVCGVLAFTALMQRLKSNIIPSQARISKLEKITDFYADYYLKLERLWYDFEKKIITEVIMLDELHKLEQSERKINKTVNEIITLKNYFVYKKSSKLTTLYLKSSLNF